DTDPAEVAEQSDARGPRLRQQRCGQGDGQSDEEEGKAAAGGRLGAGDDLRAQHRRPQGHERADDGQADPAEQVEQSVGGEQARVPGISDVAGEDDAESRAHRQDRSGGQIVVDGPGETGGQGVADLGPQVGSVPDDGGGHGRGADDDDRHTVVIMPTMTTRVPVLMSPSRMLWLRRSSGEVGVCSSACAKYWDHTRIEWLTAPRTRRWIISQRATGSPGWAPTTMRRKTSQMTTGMSRTIQRP